MTEKQQQRFEKLIEDGYTLVGVEYLEKGWNLFRQYLPGFAGFAIAVALVELILHQFGLIIFSFLVSSLLMGPLVSAAYYWVARRIDRSESYEPKDFLYVFKFVMPLVMVNLLMTLIIGIVLLPSIYALQSAGFFEWYQEVLANPGEMPVPPDLPSRTSSVVFFNLIPLIYLFVAYTWAIPFVLFYKMSPWQALESSRRLISRKWFAVFGLVLIIFGLMMFAALPLGMISTISPSLGFLSTVGLAILNPFVQCVFYAAFAGVTASLDVEGEDEELMDHLVD
ncbi:MAG: hypothetical protein DHS20C18_02110 [Saprospiraceae bacterium]|nr:MAG: hypothetical protein DHS20C18_02110 [Saprospiraceae bacterium]